MNKEINYEKLYNTILFFTQNVNKSYKTKIIKLLYILETEHFKQTGVPVVGFDYVSMHLGPYNHSLNNLLQFPTTEQKDYFQSIKTQVYDNDSSLIKPSIKEFADDEFTKREIRLMTELSIKYKDSSATEIIEELHKEGSAWHKIRIENTSGNAKIPYELSLEELSNEKKEEIKYRIEESRSFMSL